MPNVDRPRFRTITSEARSVRYNMPVRIESVVDLRSDPIIIRGVDYGEIEPPQDRDEFMSWYFACRPLESISSRDIQRAEEIWRFVSGESDTTELDLRWIRTYINSRARRKGNAVVASVIVCS